MKVLVFSLFLITLCHGMNLRWFEYQPASEEGDDVEVEWRKFKQQHNKLYSTGEELRKAVFADNLRIVKEHNALHAKGLKSFTLAINQFADLTLREFTSIMNGVKSARRSNESTTYLSSNLPVTLPTAVDWRKKDGMVSEVKNQGRCGSCWAFSTTGSLEGQHFRKTGQKVDLSEQNLVDCSQDYGNNGCNGGLMTNAFTYIKTNKGIDTEEVYPYVGKEQTCHFKKSGVGATVTGFVEVTAGDEDQLMEAVASVGPVSVAIDASQSSFMLYSEGIYNEPQCSTSQLDHGVLAVGYGSEDGQDYWIVKNSWGTGWGEDGYIRMSRNQDDQCGIASMASYPLV